MSSLKYSRILKPASTHSATIWPYSRLKKKITLLAFLLQPNGFQNMFLFSYLSTFFWLNFLVFTASWIIPQTIIFISPFLKQEIMQWRRLKVYCSGKRDMEVTIYNLLNTFCFRFIDLSLLISLTVSVLIANFIEYHSFPGMVLSALYSSYHSIIIILQSGYCYYPHFVETSYKSYN